MQKQFAVLITLLSVAPISASAQTKPPSKWERSSSDIGSAISATENVDTVRLQKDVAYARQMLPHFEAIRRYSGHEPASLYWAHMMRSLALTTLGQHQEVLGIGKAITRLQPQQHEGYSIAIRAALRAGKPMEALPMLEAAAANLSDPIVRDAFRSSTSRAVTRLMPMLAEAGGEAAQKRAQEAVTKLGW